MSNRLTPAHFQGLSIYQDVVLGSETVRRGVRDCPGRWRQLEPFLPTSGAILDIGSNFGWFGLQICQSRPNCVVASVEADPRSALVQREVLASHQQTRIALLTAKANSKLITHFRQTGQRFRAALCLSILHWLPDHRDFLLQLGEITDRILIEYPHADEVDAGNSRIRAEIGPLHAYLRQLFPVGRIEQIGVTGSHLAPLDREIWLVDPAGTLDANRAQDAAAASEGLFVDGLLSSGLSWPPRSWWSAEMQRFQSPTPQECEIRTSQVSARLTASGLAMPAALPTKLARWKRQFAHLPEDRLAVPGGPLVRPLRQAWRTTRQFLGRSRAG